MSARIVPTAAGPWNSPEERADRARYWRERAAHYRGQSTLYSEWAAKSRSGVDQVVYSKRATDANHTADMCEERAVKLEQP